MGSYVGVSDSSKEISGIYLGDGIDVKEISEGYISDADGNVKEIYSSVEPGQRIFTTSGTFIVPDKVKKVDVFLVGGGGMGGCSMWKYSNNWMGTQNRYSGGAGGGGGYTTTAKGVSVTPGQQYSIVVGAGHTVNCWVGEPGNWEMHAGSSTAFGYEATGGENGWGQNSNSGSKGGSGGGFGSYNYYTDSGSNINNYAGNGGFDGSNGYDHSKTSTSEVSSTTGLPTGAKGQGTTTRAFGEPTGTLYAGGGGGASYGGDETLCGIGGSGGGGNGGRWSSVGVENTGGGGGGCDENYTASNYDVCEISTGYCLYRVGDYGKKGGSGIVIIRWGY